ncbi:MAG: hypothetical protein J1F64_01050 [Oscillospiraceae bacterium]|nr:hypothetical protein [Oscillospiraceae bacterium]
MMKKLLTAVLIASAVIMTAVPVSYASYGPSMPSEIHTNSQGLIYIKKPESCSASTSDKTYTISAVGTPGTVVSVYKYNASSGLYILVKDDVVIGSSGLYSMVVDLDDNSNSFRVYAQNGYSNQTVNIEINKIKQSTINKLKGISVTIRDFFN